MLRTYRRTAALAARLLGRAAADRHASQTLDKIKTPKRAA